jgi:hypothetical protein
MESQEWLVLVHDMLQLNLKSLDLKNHLYKRSLNLKIVKDEHADLKSPKLFMSSRGTLPDSLSQSW